MALGLGKHNKLLGSILTILSVVVGFSRVYVGHNYPMYVMGAYVMVFASRLVYNLTLRNKVEDFYEAVEKKLATRFGFKKLYDEN